MVKWPRRRAGLYEAIYCTLSSFGGRERELSQSFQRRRRLGSGLWSMHYLQATAYPVERFPQLWLHSKVQSVIPRPGANPIGEARKQGLSEQNVKSRF